MIVHYYKESLDATSTDNVNEYRIWPFIFISSSTEDFFLFGSIGCGNSGGNKANPVLFSDDGYFHDYQFTTGDTASRLFVPLIAEVSYASHNNNFYLLAGSVT